MPNQFDISAFAKSLSVIADATRLGIIFELLKGPAPAKRLAFVVQKKSIFYHLKVLERAGVIRTIREGTQTEYCLVGSWVEQPGDTLRGFRITLGEFPIVLLNRSTAR